MRNTKLLILILAVTCMLPRLAKAGNPNLELSASDTEIILSLFDSDLDREENACGKTTDRACGAIYSLIYKGTAVNPPPVPKIDEVFVDPDDAGTLHLRLSGPISLNRTCTPAEQQKLDADKKKCIHELSDFTLALRRVVMGPKKAPGGFTIPIAPTVAEDFGSRETFIYRGIRRTLEPPSLKTLVVTAIDMAAKVAVPVRIAAIESASQNIPPDGQTNWRLFLVRPLPRERNLQFSVSGLERYGDRDLAAAGQIRVQAFPKGRDDAMLYIRGQKVYNQLGNDQGSVDFKLGQTIVQSFQGREWWYLLSATVGSASLGLSQTGTASVGHRWWLGIDDDPRTKPSWAVSVAPSFRTDRDFKNRDLGLDLILEGQPEKLYQTIERKRKDADQSGADPNRILHGWWLKPKFAVEGGSHLASSSDRVEGKAFSRAVAGFNLLLERDRAFTLFGRLSLSVDVAARYLAQEEATIDKDKVLEISDGYKPYLRAELAYGFGPVALSVVHENGKLPPAFKTARATTVGLTFKF